MAASVLFNFNAILMRSNNGCFLNFSDEVYFCDKIEIFGHFYKVGGIICTERQSLPIFGEIYKIIVNQKQQVCFIYEEYATLSFNEHLYAFEVCKNTGVLKGILECDTHFVSSLIITPIAEKKFIALF